MRAPQQPLTLVMIVACLAGLAFAAPAAEASGSAQAAADTMEVRGCGPKEKEVKFSADTDKKNHPMPPQPADKALVYVLRPTMMGNRVQTTFAVDGEWKGVNRGNNYFFFTLPPGEHVLCSKAENRSTLLLTVQAGKTYFVQQHIQMGMMKSRTSLELMTEAEAMKKLPGLNPSTWQIKK
jgi:Protein of unknown function (DUF2846)